jgi:putative ABC transport system permease protein
METLIQDIRYGARMLARTPGFSAAAILALALGIGANTAIFSVVNAVLLRPLPYHDPDRLVKVWMKFTGIGLPNDQNWVSAPEFVDLREMSSGFSHLAAYAAAGYNLTSGGLPERIEGAMVSASFFPLLGIEARLGRVFLPDEEQPGRDSVVLVSHGLWQRRFGANPNLPGTALTINNRSYTVAGVLPRGFQFPDDAEMWTPLAFSPQQLSPNSRGSHFLQVLARIKPALTLQQARADMDAVSRRIMERNPQYPYKNFNFAVLLVPLLEEMVGDIETALWILMGAVGFVLLIACANVANLLLARASAREREIAVRAALGAGRRRLVRQLLTESVILSLIGGAAGLLLARWGLSVLTTISATVFPRVAGAQLDARVLAFTMLISLATGVLFGLVPALQISRSVTYESLKEGGRSASSGLAPLRLRRLLVVAEVALSLILLAGAGLLMKSFLRLQEVDAGFRPDGVLTLRIALPQARYPQPAQVRTFYRDLLDRIEKLPGVDGAGAVSVLPLGGQSSSGTTTVDSPAVDPQNASPEADWRVVTPGYFRGMGIALISGRYFDQRDIETAQPVAIIDETMARIYWPNQDAVGKRLKRGGAQSTNPWMTIVGVVRHIRHRTLEASSRVQLYWPHTQTPVANMSLVIRSLADPRALANAVQKQVLAIDSDLPIYRVRTMLEWMAASVARRRLSMLLLAIFAGAALVLAAVGIYGVMSYSVAQRAHEMGIRMALGATRAHILRLVLGQSLSLAAAGVVAGGAGSLLLTRLISNLLFDVKPADPANLLLVAALLTAVALLASYIPARRATLVDPLNTLRQE